MLVVTVQTSWGGGSTKGAKAHIRGVGFFPTIWSIAGLTGGGGGKSYFFFPSLLARRVLNHGDI